jgi:hypothetical protein
MVTLLHGFLPSPLTAVSHRDAQSPANVLRNSLGVGLDRSLGMRDVLLHYGFRAVMSARTTAK